MKILITGSSGSIGSILSNRFLKLGYAVYGVDIVNPNQGFINELDISELSRWNFSKIDLTDELEIDRYLENTSCNFDVVINNAGWIFNMPIISLNGGKINTHEISDWKKVFKLNAEIPFLVLSKVAAIKIEQSSSLIVINISSVCSMGNAGQVAYSAAKSAVDCLTRVAAKELGPFGIRVAGLAPGFIATQSTYESLKEQEIKKIKKITPLGRLGTQDELFDAIRFIVSNNYFHGKTLELDGGVVL